MYVACVAALIPGARTVLYDGSPFFPKPTDLIKLISSEKVTHFGTSPRWMFEIMKLGISPQKVADLSSLKGVSSTGMVLSDQLFEWFYDGAFPSHVRLANMSGGTDIVCFPQLYATGVWSNTSDSRLGVSLWETQLARCMSVVFKVSSDIMVRH